ncbi:TetR/AcrR family transcriptional repressor of nem operon [Cryobacterium sp. CAN_C3]|uniref:TetR family transcriptional regulator n=1 Tax=unclassified Cryobacterium TaxID=2649013 RepID=UPI0018C99E1C|nr:TetR/AcrR family transcriptional regulator [Cryobacterium sp. CAN_C3]MEC5155856.1 TetR/AcrR family transcriptional repressor of nem operon [Cryobacterium sp. CAN_C3]
MSMTHAADRTPTIASAESCTATVILDAATKEFDECGFSGASVTQIANRAGTSRSLVSYYFPTKSRIASTIVRMAYPGGIFMGINREASDPLDAISQAAEHVSTCFVHHPLARVALKLQRSRDVQLDGAPARCNGWIVRVGDYLDEARRDGLIPMDTDVPVQARLLVAGIVGIIEIAFTTGNYLAVIDDCVVVSRDRIDMLRNG